MIYLHAPKDFSPTFEVVSCFCECEGRFLLLKRQDHKSEGNKWGMPAGKVDAGETLVDAMKRELREETGIEVRTEDLTFLHTVYIRYPDYDFVYNIYSTTLDTAKTVIIEPKEHKDAAWVSPHEALKMNLVHDLDSCIRLYTHGRLN